MANIVVTNTNDSGEGSLRQAILDANASAGADTISFTGSVFTDATPDTITLTSGVLTITDDVTIEGTGANQLTVSGNNASRVFNIFNAGTDATIDALTIANGNGINGGGIAINSGASLVLTDSTVSNNNSGGTFGGAGIANQGGTVNVINSTISGNTSTFFGGGIASQGTLTVTNSTISGNSAGIDGGGVIEGGLVTFTSSVITNNTAGRSGGGLAVFFGTTTTQNTIIAGNTAPQSPDVLGNTIQVNYSVTTNEDDVFNANVLINDTDPDTDVVLTISEVNGNAANVGNQITLLSGALLTLNSDGSYNYNPNGQFESLAAGATANDSFTYTISFGSFISTVTANLTIDGVNDAATIAGTTTAAVTEDTNVVDGSLTATGSLTISDVDTGENIFNTNVTSATGNLGSLSITEAGAYTYNVANSAVQYLGAGATKTDTFTVSSIDGTATQDITITINGVNDAPTVANAIANQTTLEDGFFSFTLPANTFADVDAGDSLTYTATLANGNPLPTWLSFNANTRTFSGTPDDPDNGTISIKVTATDTSNASANTTFNLTVTPVNDAPVAGDDSATANQNTPLTLLATNLLANDTDVDSSTLSITAVSNAVNGSVTLNNSGDVVFTPTAGFTGNGSFNYTVSDGNGGTDVAMVTVAVGVNLNGTNNNDNLNGTSGNDIINGLNAQDTISGNAGDDCLVGDNGDDLLYGGTGNDKLYGGNGQDTLSGDAGNDRLEGDNGDDKLYGGDGNDSLIGGNGQDLLVGGAGNDFLDGDKGDDNLTGGIGSDTFVLEKAAGRETITDFSLGEGDKIGLSGLSFSQLSFSGNQISLGNQTLAVLTGFNTTTLTQSNFVSV